MKKSFAIGLASTAVALSATGILGVASAATTTSSTQSLIDKLATKFNLKSADVQAVFDADKAEKDAARTAVQSAQLQKMVDKGTITTDQKTKILAKQAELKSARDSEHRSLEKWATDNGIDAKYLMMGRHGGSDESTQLQALVDNATITADQKTKIIAKQAELKTKRDADKKSIEKWATDNGIDAKYLMGSMGRMGAHGGGHGPGGPGGHGMDDMGTPPAETSSTSTSSN